MARADGGAAVQLYRTLADALKTELGAARGETRAVFAELARGGEERTIVTASADIKPRMAPRYGPQAMRRAGWTLRITPRHLPVAFAAAILPAWLSSRSRLFLIAICARGQRSGVVAERAASATPANAISIAVLPFANLSGDSDKNTLRRMTEEIITTLAKVPDLRVVARESASQYKGEKIDLRAWGRRLRNPLD